MPLSNEKCFRRVVIAIVVVSILAAGTGLYVGFALNDIVLLASVLVTIVMFVALFSEFTGLFKDHLNKNERESAKSKDVSKLKKSTY